LARIGAWWPGEPMKSYAVVAGIIFTAFSVIFLLVGEVGGVPLLADPSPWLRQPDGTAALVGAGLLVIDAVLPVPSSLVMIAHGALFGVALGALLSLFGSLGAMLVGFAIGRRGEPLVARFVAPPDRATAEHLLARWGTLAIVVTRPVPLLAETVAVLAGASSLGWRKATLAALVGSLPAAVIYALAGATVAGFGSGALIFGAVVVLAGCTWLVGQAMERRIVRNQVQTLARSAPP
jgi:uncharacterized membrane protein YdjX (TVP38/TMEM64 family)